jgi:squalene synthase HpnC
LHFPESCAEIDTVTRGATPVSHGRGPLSVPGAEAPGASRWQETGVSPAREPAPIPPGSGPGDAPADGRPGDAPAAVIAAGATAQAAAENFPVALRLLPARYRRHLMAVYRFARTVDDIGDGPVPAAPAERLRLLDEVEDDLGRLYRGEPPRLEVIGQLAATVTACGVPDRPLRDLIQANRQDQLVSRYQTFDDLAGYCELSANPVGRIVLHVFGASTPRRARLSDHVCTALQLAEHWQDVAEDLRAGRIYLPLDDLARFGCTEQALAAPAAGPEVRTLMSFQVARASALLSAGAPLIATLHGAARLAVAGYVAGGRAALAAIEAARYDVLGGTPRPGKRRLAAELARAYAGGR